MVSQIRKGRRIFRDLVGNRNVVDWEMSEAGLLIQFYDENGEPFRWKVLRHGNPDRTYDLVAIIENPVFTIQPEEFLGYSLYESLTQEQWRHLVSDSLCYNFPNMLRNKLEEIEIDIIREEDNRDRSPIPIFDAEGRWIDEPIPWYHNTKK